MSYKPKDAKVPYSVRPTSDGFLEVGWEDDEGLWHPRTPKFSDEVAAGNLRDFMNEQYYELTRVIPDDEMIEKDERGET